tara:strand:+ start:5153 stop:5644 length:492 start_codon:yes stop_codon:yes gene_type:complete
LFVHILDIDNNQLVDAEIVPASDGQVPLKKNGWSFNWKNLLKEDNSEVFTLKLKDVDESIEGMLQLKIKNEMLVMEVLEIAPHNIGRENKKYDYVAGCLIAFACRESFKLESEYKGYLTFVSKANLIEWYKKKYRAEQGLGQRMFISDESGLELISEYLNRAK